MCQIIFNISGLIVAILSLTLAIIVYAKLVREQREDAKIVYRNFIEIAGECLSHLQNKDYNLLQEKLSPLLKFSRDFQHKVNRFLNSYGKSQWGAVVPKCFEAYDLLNNNKNYIDKSYDIKDIPDKKQSIYDMFLLRESDRYNEWILNNNPAGTLSNESDIKKAIRQRKGWLSMSEGIETFHMNYNKLYDELYNIRYSKDKKTVWNNFCIASFFKNIYSKMHIPICLRIVLDISAKNN